MTILMSALTILQRVKVVIHALLGEELLVVADLLDFAFAHDDDLVGVLDGGEAVRDDEGCAAFDDSVDSVLDEELRFSIYV